MLHSKFAYKILVLGVDGMVPRLAKDFMYQGNCHPPHPPDIFRLAHL